MEEQAETILNGQLSRIENYPELADRMRLHLDETRQQAARLKACLDRMDEGSSTMKDAAGKFGCHGAIVERHLRRRRGNEGIARELHVRTHGNRFLHDPHCRR
nr:DUF892 family protein [Mesorhizobium sp.]